VCTVFSLSHPHSRHSCRSVCPSLYKWALRVVCPVNSPTAALSLNLLIASSSLALPGRGYLIRILDCRHPVQAAHQSWWLSSSCFWMSFFAYETLATKHKPALRNCPEQRRPNLQRDGSRKLQSVPYSEMFRHYCWPIRVIKMELLIGNVCPVTERSVSQCLSRAVSTAWSVSSKCRGFRVNFRADKYFSTSWFQAKEWDSVLCTDSIDMCYNVS
jgi:hypothetical protein